jgi:hypothetical protein|nr:MAG TPA: putative endonuclease [Caudoviricetes sp.]
MAAPQLSVILQVAKEILTDNRNKAMHVNEIAKIAVQTNRNMAMSEEDFANKVSAALAANVKTKSPTFIKPKNPKTGAARKGYYKLKKTAMQPTVAIPKIKAPAVKTTFAGRAGEYAVASELLFWGYNVATAAIDEGIDLIVETRPNTFQYVQVKTAAAKSDGLTFDFKIEEKAFTATASRKPWYIFVMRQELKNTFAVIPFSHLAFLKQQGVIRGTNLLSIQITRDESGRQYKLCGSDINLFINNFELLDNLLSSM